MLLLAIVIGLCARRARSRKAAAPEGAGADPTKPAGSKPSSKQGYSSVGRDEEAQGQEVGIDAATEEWAARMATQRAGGGTGAQPSTPAGAAMCGAGPVPNFAATVPDVAVDAATEEWAARIAAQRAGGSVAAPTSTSLTCAAGLGLGPGACCCSCGAGPVPSFGSPAGGAAPAGRANGAGLAAAEDEAAAFAGFDGFGGDPEVTMEYDERSGWKSHQHSCAAAHPAGGSASGAQYPAGAAAGAAPWSLGLSPVPVPTCCAFSDDIDWGLLGGPSQEEAPRTAPRGAEPADATGGGGDDDSDEDGFTVFDGFGKEGGTKGGGGAGGASTSAGLSWDEERKMWEQKNNAGGGRRGSSGGSPWDLRSPSSLRALRSQAEKVFDGAVGNSLFTSPSIRRLRQSTDELFSGVRSLFRFSWFS